ncbi:efflux transporter periplasmic adaptor subunit [Variovorax sp. WS11]|uniref:efflux RND transporter periplasmic adaptor subunit n=1 Tax=Variovorax sp. WS11 TaxID=1105204 RepID=UPI000D0E0FB4|nr:efflux RND transporter periplasmic adaptor subunit [Variovorax sp. WS11]NDZ11654.1 efflux RND transporter periplasmic adaptor subunit [Variovorax sp. WS11]PSL86510.1 efflux transporter periplasmic adaptor subunit [Variovorax sp. WS11]
MTSPNKKKAAIAAILILGLLAAVAILTTGRSPGSAEHGHEETEAHADHDHHGEESGGGHKEPEEAHAHGEAKKDKAKASTHKDEAKVALTEAQIQAAGITQESAGSARVQATLQLPGEIRFNDDRTAHVVPRLAGVVESVPASLGQQVRKGQLLAVIASTALSEQRSELLTAERRLALARATHAREESLWKDRISAEQDVLQARAALEEAQIAVRNAQQKLRAVGAGASAGALNQFELRAPFDGTLVEKHISLGEAVREDANVFTLSDLSTVWAEMAVPAQEIGRVRVGEKVIVSSTASQEKAEGTISYVGALIGEQTRTAKARVTLANPQLAWRPGLFVTITVLAEEAEVPVAVRAEAIQTLSDRSVVFLAVPGGFVAQPVKLGRAGGPFVEIVEGLQPGARYAAANSYVLKSEQGKAGASHTH